MRGLALVLVVGVLGILAVLGSAFAVLARLERRSAAQRVHATRAYLLARSGLEDGCARILEGQDPTDTSNLYGGEDWLGDGDQGAGSFDRQQEVHRPGVLDVEGCPARHALRPSFFRRNALQQPLLQAVARRQRGSTGRFGPDGLTWSLRAVGEDGIYVNGGDLGSDGEHAGTYDTTLKRILGNLAEEIGAPLSRADGEALVASRPRGGWSDLAAAARRLGWSAAKREAFRPYLAFHAWVDKKVIRPNLDPGWIVPSYAYLSQKMGMPPFLSTWTGAPTAAALAELRAGKRDFPLPGHLANGDPGPGDGVNVGASWTGKRRFNARTNSYAPDFERDGQGRIVGRAPVNLNWAKNKPPVLNALLRDLSGVYLDTSYGRFCTGAAPTGIEQDFGYLGMPNRITLGASDVADIAALIRNHAGFAGYGWYYPDWDGTARFDSWDEFERMLAVAWGPNTRMGILGANFNPNSALNKSNPGETYYRPLDKSDLQVYSTELCFRTPVHALSATGLVLGRDGSVLAERTLSATLSLDQLRLTTQSELCAGNLGRLDEAGDEGAFRRPGDAGFIAQSPGSARTFGSRYPPIPPAAATQGLALQTYPEPQWRGGACPPPAAYDGRLELATVEEDASTLANPGLSFLASWDDRYDATWAAGSPACLPDRGHPPPSVSLYGSGAAGPTAQMGMLHPDGCYAEAGRTPGYAALANIGDGFQGILSFWYKPSFGGRREYDVSRGSALFGLTVFTLNPQSTNFLQNGAGTQPFLLGTLPSDFLNGQLWGGILENSDQTGDSYVEQGPYYSYWNASETFAYAHRWHLVTVQWNTLATTAAAYSVLYVNQRANTSTPEPHYDAQVSTSGKPNGGGASYGLTRTSYRLDGTVGRPYFFLGSRGFPFMENGSADGTFDELMCLTRSTAMGEAGTVASGRYLRGRYGKEDAGLDPSKPEYLSCPIPLGPGARVLRADWTLVLPRYAETGSELQPPPNLAYYGKGGAGRLTGESADAAIVLTDASGAPLAPRVCGRSGGALRARPPGGTLKLGIDLRPRLGDNTGAWDKANAPLLESPVLDDVTLTYCRAGGAWLGAWREGE